MAKAIPAVPKGWQQLFVSALFIVVVPLAVLGMDLAIKSDIPDQDLFFTFGLYIIATGASSKSIAILAFSIVLTMAYLIFYGLAVQSGADCAAPIRHAGMAGYAFRYIPAAIFTAICMLERYNRHVVNAELFWDFS